MSAIVIAYGEGPAVAKVTTVTELDELFDAIDAEARAEEFPAAVIMYAEDEGVDGPNVNLGLGREWSVLSWGGHYIPGDLDAGEPSAWFYGNQWSYIGPGHGIPIETAREVAREFVRTGQRPASVEWVAEV